MAVYDDDEKPATEVAKAGTNIAKDRAEAYEASAQFIEQMTSKCDEIQGKVLAEILSQNAETEYLKRHDMSDGCIDRETFKCKVPLVAYEDIKPDIVRIYNGDFSPILCAQPVSELWLSSGTSEGQGKLLPATNDEMQRRHMSLTSVMPFIKQYRVGDVLTPTCFYNSTPQFKFVRKRDVLLSIDFAKTTEIDLQKAIDNASSVLHIFNTKVVEYTSYADVNNVPGHYVIYMELTTIDQANRLRPEILEQCCFAMEGSFGVQYRNGRVDESIGPLEIRVVSNGTFEKLRDNAISKGASFIQYKVPRCVKLLPMLELLNNEVESTHFSPCVPDTVHKLLCSDLDALN